MIHHESDTRETMCFVKDWFASDQKKETFQEVRLADTSSIVQHMGEDLKLAEMGPGQHKFLCGLLRQEKPAKIVEVGVASGGTTAVIVNFLNGPEMEPEKTHFYSIDISTKYYLQPEHETGYIARKYDQDSRVHHEYMLGDVCAAFLNKICADGKGIDFLILDTAHILPGEVLDFLVCLPYLNPGAVVVLHDVTLSVVVANAKACIATGTMFSAVHGEKFYTPDLDGGDLLSNIAAFRINADTKRYIRDLFFALSLHWDTLPGEHALAVYRRVIHQAYDSSLVELYDHIIELQKKCLCMEKIPHHLGYSLELLREQWLKCEHVYLYGTGYWGNMYYCWARLQGLKVDGMLVSDDRTISEMTRVEFDVPVYHLSELPSPSEACGVILAMEGDNYESGYKNLMGKSLRILNDRYGH